MGQLPSKDRIGLVVFVSVQDSSDLVRKALSIFVPLLVNI